VLESLADKSMVVRERAARTGLRFNMLETMRAFAHERLREMPEGIDARRRLHDYIRRLVIESQPNAFSARSDDWIDLIDEEYANIRDTIESSISDATLAGPLMYSLFWFWYRRGRLSEARTWVDAAFAAEPPPGEARALLAFAGAAIAMWQGDLDVARTWCSEGYAALRQSDDGSLQGASAFMLAVVLINRGETADARPLLAEAINRLAPSRVPRDRFFISLSHMHLANVELSEGNDAAAREALAASLDASRDAGDAWLMASVLNNLGEVARTSGDYAGAADHYQESLALFEQADVPSDVARLLSSLAIVAAQLRETTRARTLVERSAQLHRASGNKRGLAECVLAAGCALARDAVDAGDTALARRAVVLLSATRSRIEDIQASFWPADQATYDAALALVRPLLDDATFAAASHEGQSRRSEDVASLTAV
jgi:non-specific serine/threonine protein kinase